MQPYHRSSTSSYYSASSSPYPSSSPDFWTPPRTHSPRMPTESRPVYVKSRLWYRNHVKPSKDEDLTEGLGISRHKFHRLKEKMRYAASEAKPPSINFRGNKEDTISQAIQTFCNLVPEVAASRSRCPPDWFKEARLHMLRRFSTRNPQANQTSPDKVPVAYLATPTMKQEVQPPTEDVQRGEEKQEGKVKVRKRHKKNKKWNGWKRSSNQEAQKGEFLDTTPSAPRSMKDAMEPLRLSEPSYQEWDSFVMMVTLPNTNMGEVVKGSEILVENGERLSLGRFKRRLESRSMNTCSDDALLLVNPEDGQMLPLRCESVFHALLSRCMQAGHRTLKIVLVREDDWNL